MRLLVALVLSLLSVTVRAQQATNLAAGATVAPTASPTSAAPAAPTSAPAATTPTATPPAAGPSASPAATAVQEGLEALRTGRGNDALAALVRARESEPTRVEAHYYLGVALRREGRLEDALVTFRTAVSVASTSNDATWGVRSRIAIADTLERMPGRLAEARAAWIEVRDLATAGNASIPADLPRTRLEAIDAKQRLDDESGPVRQRIEGRANAAHGAPPHPAGHGGAAHGHTPR